MDLLDQIEQVQHPKVTYDTQVVRPVDSGSDNSDVESDNSQESDNSDLESDLESNTNVNTPGQRQDIEDIQSRILAKLNAHSTNVALTQVIDTHLPQLEIDESEIGFNQTTQKVGPIDTQRITQPIATQTQHIVTQTQPVAQDTQNDVQDQPSSEERLRVLIEQKKQQRELKKQELENDISNVTLTDEENDEYNDTTVQSRGKKAGARDLDEAQQFLDNQKKEQFFENMTRGPATKKKFSAASFVNAFTEEFLKPAAKEAVTMSSNDEREEEGGITYGSPATSPINESLKIHPSSHNPIEIYKQNLKQFDEIDLENIDEEMPILTKDLKLSIKQKFVRANISKLNKHFKNGKLDATGHNYLKQLFSMNIDQLSANPNKNFEDIEEEKNEEIMGSLLEREIERAREIRKQEKLKQKARMALLGKNTNKPGEDEEFDGDYNGEENSGWDESEVPNSDMDSDLEISGAEDVREGEESDQSQQEDNNESEDDEEFSAIGIRRKAKVMESDDEERDMEDDKLAEPDKDDSRDLSFHNSQLFKNLKPMENIPESLELEETFEEISPSQINNKSFVLDLSQQNKSTQGDKTQPDATQVDTSTQMDTQVNSTQVDKTQLVGIDEVDEDITPEMVSKAKRSIAQNQFTDSEDEEPKEPAETEEQIQERIKQYEAKIRKKELKMVQRRKEMERKGYNRIIEGEAEESEDEWAGLGGKDGEHDEDRPDSEDERMIDNNFNIDLNNEEIRNKFMEQYQIKDKKELEKLIDDIKNHKLVKRSNGLDIELSDEEDEILLNYRKQKLKEQKLKLQQMNQSLSKFKTDKSKAFFESIQEDLDSSLKIRLDEDDKQEESDHEDEELDDGEKPLKSIKIGEDFIRQKLSFLTESVNEYELEQKKSNFQYNISDSEEEDLNTLKQKSMNNLRKRPLEEIEIETDDDQEDKGQENVSDMGDDFDEDLLPARKPSMIKSFMSSQSTTGSSFSGVTVSKQYKTASGSKASITFMSKKKKQKISKLQTSRKFTPKVRQNLHSR